MNTQTENKYISLFELMSVVRCEIEQRLDSYYWIVAEISEIKNHSSGHCYLELVDKIDDNHSPRARANAVIWANRFTVIDSYFRAETGQTLKRGLKILVKCRVTFHELYSLSLQIVDIDPVYTIGEVSLRRKQTIEQLKSDGIFDLNRECAASVVFQRIAVISSAQAAGYQDFMNELNASQYSFDVELFNAAVQGESAAGSVIEALDKIYDLTDLFDCVVLIRGGGSQHDLSCFDSYEMCVNLAQFPLPVLTGIGHDKDVSVADMVAYKSLKTPTAVAAHLVGMMDLLNDRLMSAQQSIHLNARSQIEIQKQNLERLISQLNSETIGSLGHYHRKIAIYQTELKQVYAQLGRERLKLENTQQMLSDRVRSIIENNRLRLDGLNAVVRNLSPQRVLNMGYSIVRVGGRAISSACQIGDNREIQIEMADAELTANVKRIKTK